eukprot:TRINITY_DN919_c0_g1_i7.p1 TRINITY_DN919_c0_g1~~TRINITY_DN919_c0_g1_i7.p1  ORF type:complete len:423 (-),score=45.25 TRINITY_DN919_c0_g1_i7:118-1386(-)
MSIQVLLQFVHQKQGMEKVQGYLCNYFQLHLITFLHLFFVFNVMIMPNYFKALVLFLLLKQSLQQVEQSSSVQEENIYGEKSENLPRSQTSADKENMFRLSSTSQIGEAGVIERRTEFGSVCQFPFKFNNVTYNDCFWGIDGREFCKVDGFFYACQSLWPDHDHELETIKKEEQLKENTPMPSQSQVRERYTVNGQKCELPKWYNGRYLTDCLYISATRELCFASLKWQYCEPLKAPSPAPTVTEIAAKRRFTVSGKMCELPFVHLGKEYDDCIEFSGGKKWCKLDNSWQECKSVEQEEQSMQTNLQAGTYAPGFDVVAGSGEVQKQEQGGANGALVGMSILLAFLLLAAGSMGVGLFIIHQKNCTNIKNVIRNWFILNDMMLLYLKIYKQIVCQYEIDTFSQVHLRFENLMERYIYAGLNC